MSFAKALLLAGTVAQPAGDRCTALAGAERTAAAVPAGTRVPTGPSGGAVSLSGFCRVEGVLRPVAGSRIGYQLWLPAPGKWTGRFQMFGNGGYSAELPLGQMAAAVARGSAAIATDTGHSGDDPDFARGAPEAIVDWGWRGVHLSAVEGQRLTARYYGRAARYRYFAGCSTGGHQAMMEAQRFPDDFDGIVAGAPGANRVTLNAAFLWQFVTNNPTPGRPPLLDASDLKLLQDHALATCHTANGAAAGGLAADGWLNDPLGCRPDPAALLCRPGGTGDCLTAAQVQAAAAMYRGATDPRTGKRVTLPWLPGSEAGWAAYWADPRQPDQPARANFWRLWTGYGDRWQPSKFDWGRDLAAARTRLGPVIDAVDPDLDGFRRRGGRLLQYHGLADPVVSPLDTIAYRDAVARRTPKLSAWNRLFLVPGMGHCAGGPGFWRFDAQTAIERWVEQGQAPDRLVAGQAAGTATRPLCPYPQRARFRAGPTDAADSFVCEAPLSRASAGTPRRD
ncbi:feruloyl esterase [Sphingomonas guangdongensis]|uniref:Feruloyl esterase n=1 Tax=Sphingomonas guangdongensis TaxID=1141890 RepID=A0A285QX15_9SPHN|nr:tannase/feruloyl esterase family alpha/beta hydrolase [Sphingomonas guangdongensis]SOB86381.1 feruloyl esterase [Sphingomonas guangdongensis]